MKCRGCGSELHSLFLDLGFAPPSNAYLTEVQLSEPETYYPLRLLTCKNCLLVQTEDFTKSTELFKDDYAYFSSTSSTWVKHAKDYAEGIIDELGINEKSFVVEIASNDGYLLRNFISAGVPCLGVEPTLGTAAESEKLGIPVLKEFFGKELSKKIIKSKGHANLVIANNVLAHVPDLIDFIGGLRVLLSNNGTITLEFPHLLKLIEKIQFDTVYHEHYSYFSIHALKPILGANDLKIYKIVKLTTHGGSLRVYVTNLSSGTDIDASVETVMSEERDAGLDKLNTYINFQNKVDDKKNNMLNFFLEARSKGKKIIGYGAAAKGNTYLNYAGIKKDLISCVCDAALSKQGKYLPGSHLPIVNLDIIRQETPDYIFIFPWNIKREVEQNLSYVREWGGKFVTAAPDIVIN